MSLPFHLIPETGCGRSPRSLVNAGFLGILMDINPRQKKHKDTRLFTPSSSIYNRSDRVQTFVRIRFRTKPYLCSDRNQGKLSTASYLTQKPRHPHIIPHNLPPMHLALHHLHIPHKNPSSRLPQRRNQIRVHQKAPMGRIHPVKSLPVPLSFDA